MSEVDDKGHVLSTFTDVIRPWHLSTDNRDQVFVADLGNNRILLLSTELPVGLRPEHVLIDTKSQVKLRGPTRLSYNECASQLHVLHGSYFKGYFISSVRV